MVIDLLLIQKTLSTQLLLRKSQPKILSTSHMEQSKSELKHRKEIGSRQVSEIYIILSYIIKNKNIYSELC